MSKNTKIIAIIGGSLIVVLVGYTMVFGGGFGQAMESMGCGAKKEPRKPRTNLENFDLSDCLNTGFSCQRDPNGQPKMAKGSKECEKKPADFCKKLWSTKCKDAKFMKDNKSGCKKFTEAAAKEDEKDDD